MDEKPPGRFRASQLARAHISSSKAFCSRIGSEELLRERGCDGDRFVNTYTLGDATASWCPKSSRGPAPFPENTRNLLHRYTSAILPP
jgi:hypothetical protein